MARPTLIRTLVAAAVLTLGATGPAWTQDPEQQQATPEQQELMQEFQELQQRVSTVEQQAMEQNPELQEELAEAQEAVIEAMIEIRPETEGDLKRLEELEADIRTAQQEEDAEQMQALMGEAVGLTEQLNQTQAEAMERDDVADRLDAFQDSLMVQMTEIEPETETMVARMQEIAQQLQ